MALINFVNYLLCRIVEEISQPLPLALPPSPVEERVTWCDPSYSGRLLESLRMLCDQQVFTDAVVVSEDSSYHKHVHRVVLASASSYLKSLIFNSDQPVLYIIVPGRTHLFAD